MKFTENDLASLPQKNGFRLRGIGMTRLETFMDAAFAFATTMLVISVGEIPGNYQELILALKEIPSFLSSFLIIMLFWGSHRSWSRRYGLEDSTTIFISIGLIFVLLVYIYPLRLMFSALFYWISGGWFPSRLILNSLDELIGLFIIYGIGFMAMAGLMSLLYVRAIKSKENLGLNGFEFLKTQSEILAFLIISATGLISALLAWILPAGLNTFAVFIYATLPVTVPLAESKYVKKRRKLIEEENQ